jgi:ATP-dependent DNA ligase/DNA-binding MarR family transcriptional regulator
MADLRPMLATPIPLDGIGPYVANEKMVAQQKIDGDRLMVVVDNGRVTPLNRKGDRYSNPLPSKVLRQFQGLPGRWCFDGELLDELWLFDLPVAGDAVTPSMPYEFRLSVLERFFASWRPDPVVRLLPTARTQWAKRSLIDQVLSSRHEGIIFRDLDAPYTSGKRSLRMVKAKVVKTIDCVVTGVHVDGKNNCHVSLFENGQLVEVGSCAMLGKPDVIVGDVVEVKYLYADTARRLVQSAFLRVRDDKAPTECTIDQLVFTNRSVIDHGGLIPLSAAKKRKEPGEGLGRTQVLVLRLLYMDSKSVRTLSYDGFGLTESSARAALQRLGMRGLVDREHRQSTRETVYFLTAEGAEVERALTGIDDDEDSEVVA